MNALNHRMISAYRKARECVPQPWMVAILLKGVLHHLAAAQQAFAEGRRPQSIHRTSKAIAVLHGLRSHLRPGVSAVVAERLDRFYDATILQIANLVRTGFDEKACSRIVANVTLLYDAWSALGDNESGRD